MPHLRRIFLAVPVGIVGGLLSAAFLKVLEWTEQTRPDHGWLVWLLPGAGLLIGLAYQKAGPSVAGGNAMLFDRVDDHGVGIPFRLTPLALAASTVSHVAGASVGREGVALQMTAGAVDGWGTRLGLDAHERSLLLVTAIAAAFGSIVGAPIAGAVFALEVRRGHNPTTSRSGAVVSALTASAIATGVVSVTGISRTAFPGFPRVDLGADLVGRVLLASAVCGVLAFAFVTVVGRIRALLARTVAWPPLRPVIGGFVVAILVVTLNWSDYQGLSLHLAVDAQVTDQVGSLAEGTGQWWAKFCLTVVSVGSGFVGGEVVPLIVIGALSGAAVGRATGGDAALLAILGAVAMLAGGAKAPIACTVLGAELFGWNGVAYFLTACLIARAVSGRGSIYGPVVSRSS